MCDLQNLLEIPSVDFLNLDKSTVKFSETFIMKVKCVLQHVLALTDPGKIEETQYL